MGINANYMMACDAGTPWGRSRGTGPRALGGRILLGRLQMPRKQGLGLSMAMRDPPESC